MSESRVHRRGWPSYNKIAQQLGKMLSDARGRYERFMAAHAPKPVEFASVEFRPYCPVVEGWYLRRYGILTELVYVNDRQVYAMGERPSRNDSHWAGPIIIPQVDIQPIPPTPDYTKQTIEELAT